MTTKRYKKLAELAGYVGMVFVHSAIVPTTIMNIMGWSTHTPPLNMVILIQIGLFLFLIRAIATRDMLYSLSNGFGFLMQSILLSVIVLR